MAQMEKNQSHGELNLVYIPAGTFLMGTSDQQVDRLALMDDLAKTWKEKGHFCREKSQHPVFLESYYIGKFPVSVREYREFVNADGYQQMLYWTTAGWIWRETKKRNYPDFWDDEKWAGDANLPVVGVSWYEALAYCRWLSDRTGKPCRLPTEAEWEKAARGEDDRLYPWGNTFDIRLCNTRASGHNRTQPVGLYSPQDESPYGCAEMAGNVSEWTLSQYKPYPYEDDDGRNDEEGETERVIRGGAWYKPALRARVSARGMNDPFFVDLDVGFRCVLAD